MLAMKEEVDWAKLKSGDSYEQGSVVFMTCVQTWWCSAGQAGREGGASCKGGGEWTRQPPNLHKLKHRPLLLLHLVHLDHLGHPDPPTWRWRAHHHQEQGLSPMWYFVFLYADFQMVSHIMSADSYTSTIQTKTRGRICLFDRLSNYKRHIWSNPFMHLFVVTKGEGLILKDLWSAVRWPEANGPLGREEGEGPGKEEGGHFLSKRRRRRW